MNDKRDDDRAPSPAKSESVRDGERQANGEDGPPASPTGATPTPGFVAPVHGPPTLAKKVSVLGVSFKKSNTVETADEDADECGDSQGRTAFLHHVPHASSVLVMERGVDEQVH